eukprot:5511206-Prymnesium_polylepis.2
MAVAKHATTGEHVVAHERRPRRRAVVQVAEQHGAAASVGVVGRPRNATPFGVGRHAARLARRKEAIEQRAPRVGKRFALRRAAAVGE